MPWFDVAIGTNWSRCRLATQPADCDDMFPPESRPQMPGLGGEKLGVHSVERHQFLAVASFGDLGGLTRPPAVCCDRRGHPARAGTTPLPVAGAGVAPPSVSGRRRGGCMSRPSAPDLCTPGARPQQYAWQPPPFPTEFLADLGGYFAKRFTAAVKTRGSLVATGTSRDLRAGCSAHHSSADVIARCSQVIRRHARS